MPCLSASSPFIIGAFAAFCCPFWLLFFSFPLRDKRQSSGNKGQQAKKKANNEKKNRRKKKKQRTEQSGPGRSRASKFYISGVGGLGCHSVQTLAYMCDATVWFTQWRTSKLTMLHITLRFLDATHHDTLGSCLFSHPCLMLSVMMHCTLRSTYVILVSDENLVNVETVLMVAGEKVAECKASVTKGQLRRHDLSRKSVIPSSIEINVLAVHYLSKTRDSTRSRRFVERSCQPVSQVFKSAPWELLKRSCRENMVKT